MFDYWLRAWFGLRVCDVILVFVTIALSNRFGVEITSIMAMFDVAGS